MDVRQRRDAVPLLVLMVCLSVFLFAKTASAQNSTETERADLGIIPIDDPGMAEAIRQARKTLPKFLALAEAPRSTITRLAVKLGVGAKDGKEYFWITSFQRKGRIFVGVLANDLETVKTIKRGERLTFKKGDIVDWLYREHGEMKGNYTGCALIKRKPR
jgi:uncharacterized protein YegJ (DUF2314 family)